MTSPAQGIDIIPDNPTNESPIKVITIELVGCSLNRKANEIVIRNPISSPNLPKTFLPVALETEIRAFRYQDQVVLVST